MITLNENGQWVDSSGTELAVSHVENPNSAFGVIRVEIVGDTPLLFRRFPRNMFGYPDQYRPDKEPVYM